MRRIKRRSAVTCVVGAALAFLAVSTASAAQTCYKVTDLKALGFAPGVGERFGINSAGEAAFTAEVMVDGQPRKHAFVWLPQPNYNLAAGLHDLHDLGVLSTAAGAYEASKAHDISAIGIVAGQATTGEGEPHAFVWKLGPPVVTIDLSTYTKPARDGAPHGRLGRQRRGSTGGGR